jgi:ethanolamine ammonia-lyase small subunit
MHEPARPLSSVRLPPAVITDPWSRLRSLTPARIALGRTGHALPTREVLAADEAHARARAAVHAPLDIDSLSEQLCPLANGIPPVQVCSAARDRQQYLLRPDLGRRLSTASQHLLSSMPPQSLGSDLALVIADGLSTTAVARHAPAVVQAIVAHTLPGWTLGPMVLATQARVALGDEIGSLLSASLIAVLIGERPGLSCQESLGIYLTWQPRPGRTDAERNCLSNIHPGGLAPSEAARKLWWLANEAKCLTTTGVLLKDRSGTASRLHDRG